MNFVVLFDNSFKILVPRGLYVQYFRADNLDDVFAFSKRGLVCIQKIAISTDRYGLMLFKTEGGRSHNSSPQLTRPFIKFIHVIIFHAIHFLHAA